MSAVPHEFSLIFSYSITLCMAPCRSGPSYDALYWFIDKLTTKQSDWPTICFFDIFNYNTPVPYHTSLSYLPSIIPGAYPPSYQVFTLHQVLYSPSTSEDHTMYLPSITPTVSIIPTLSHTYPLSYLPSIIPIVSIIPTLYHTYPLSYLPSTMPGVYPLSYLPFIIPTVYHAYPLSYLPSTMPTPTTPCTYPLSYCHTYRFPLSYCHTYPTLP